MASIVDAADAGSLDAVDSISEIASPHARAQLVQFLWHPHDTVAQRAAWRIAALFREDSFHRDIERVTLPTRASNRSEYPVLPWVWRPFEKRRNSVTAVVANRSAWLIQNSSASALPPTTGRLDERIIIPAILIERAGVDDWDRDRDEETQARVWASCQAILESDEEYPTYFNHKRLEKKILDASSRLLKTGNDGSRWRENAQRLVQSMVENQDLGAVTARALSGLPMIRRIGAIRALFADARRTPHQWRRVQAPLRYRLETGWVFRALSLAWPCLLLPYLMSQSVALWQAESLVSWGAVEIATHMLACLLMMALPFGLSFVQDDEMRGVPSSILVGGLVGGPLLFLAADFAWSLVPAEWPSVVGASLVDFSLVWPYLVIGLLVALMVVVAITEDVASGLFVPVVLPVLAPVFAFFYLAFEAVLRGEIQAFELLATSLGSATGAWSILIAGVALTAAMLARGFWLESISGNPFAGLLPLEQKPELVRTSRARTG